MHSHCELNRDKLPWTTQLANNILCIPPSQLPTTSTHMTSVIAMYNYGPSHFDSRGEENKARLYPSSQTAACLESLDPSIIKVRKLSDSQKEKVNSRNQFWPDFYLKQRLPNCTPAGWTGSAGCLSRSCFHGNHWTNWKQALRETLSNAVYSPSFSEVMLN